jgi:hypothetical protein
MWTSSWQLFPYRDYGRVARHPSVITGNFREGRTFGEVSFCAVDFGFRALLTSPLKGGTLFD